jgi:hypothetical protein
MTHHSESYGWEKYRSNIPQNVPTEMLLGHYGHYGPWCSSVPTVHTTVTPKFAPYGPMPAYSAARRAADKFSGLSRTAEQLAVTVKMTSATCCEDDNVTTSAFSGQVAIEHYHKRIGFHRDLPVHSNLMG